MMNLSMQSLMLMLMLRTILVVKHFLLCSLMLMFHYIQQNFMIDFQSVSKPDFQSLSTTGLFAFWKDVSCFTMTDIGLDRGYRVIAIVSM